MRSTPQPDAVGTKDTHFLGDGEGERIREPPYRHKNSAHIVERVPIFQEDALLSVEQNSQHEDAILRMVYDTTILRRAQQWLTEQKLAAKVRVGVVAFRENDTGKIIARAKVLVSGGHFYHDEPYDDFPSDHFKTKIILVTGGA